MYEGCVVKQHIGQSITTIAFQSKKHVLAVMNTQACRVGSLLFAAISGRFATDNSDSEPPKPHRLKQTSKQPPYPRRLTTTNPPHSDQHRHGLQRLPLTGLLVALLPFVPSLLSAGLTERHTSRHSSMLRLPRVQISFSYMLMRFRSARVSKGASALRKSGEREVVSNRQYLFLSLAKEEDA